MKVHAGMGVDDEDDDYGHATIFTLERHSKAGAHRVKLRPERIPSLRLPRRPTAGEGLHTRLEEARELAYDLLCTVYKAFFDGATSRRSQSKGSAGENPQPLLTKYTLRLESGPKRATTTTENFVRLPVAPLARFTTIPNATLQARLTLTRECDSTLSTPMFICQITLIFQKVFPNKVKVQ